MLDFLKGSNGIGALPTVDLSQGLVAHYLLNNNADDVAGTYDGTAFNGIDFQGDIAKFDGIDDYITLPSAVYNQGNSFTISGWFSISDKITDYRIAHAKDGTGTGRAILSYYYVEDTFTTFIGGTPKASSITPSSATMYFFALSFNSSTQVLEMYINGVKDTFTSVTVELNTAEVAIGISKDLVSYPHKGIMSNFRFYNEAKDQTFIDALYAEGYYPKPLPLPTTDGLVAHYPLTGTAEDAWGTGGNESGTEYNGVAFVSDVDRGSCAKSDGVNDYIYYPSFDVYNTAVTRPITISQKVKVQSGATRGYSAKSGYRYRLGVGTTGYVYAIIVNSIGGSLVRIDSVNPVTLDEWHTITVTFFNKTATLWIDGVFQNTLTGTDSLSTSTTDGVGITLQKIDFGSSVYWYDSYFSDFYIIDKQISNDEALSLHNETYNMDKVVTWSPLTTEARANDMWVAYDGTEVGGLTYVDDAEFGSVANFDGVNDYIDISSIADDVPNSLTLSFWYSGTNTCYTYMHRDDDTTLYQILIATNKVTVQLRTTTYSLITINSVATLSSSQFSHITVSLDIVAGECKIYINGVLDSTNPFTINNSFNSTSTLINAYRNTSGITINTVNSCKLRNMRIYSKILSVQEITDIYNYEKNFRHIDIDDGLIAYYPLAENSLDNYRNQYDMTDVDMTYSGLCGVYNGSTSHNYKSGTSNNVMGFPYAPSNISFSCWVNFTTLDVNMGIFMLVVHDATNTTRRFNRLFFSSTYISYFGTNIPFVAETNKWYHLTYTRSSTNEIKVYIDGVLLNTATFDDTSSKDSTLYSGYNIGGFKYNLSSFANPLNGKISKDRIFNKVLTAEQVQVIYNSEKGDFGL